MRITMSLRSSSSSSSVPVQFVHCFKILFEEFPVIFPVFRTFPAYFIAEFQKFETNECFFQTFRPVFPFHAAVDNTRDIAVIFAGPAIDIGKFFQFFIDQIILFFEGESSSFPEVFPLSPPLFFFLLFQPSFSLLLIDHFSSEPKTDSSPSDKASPCFTNSPGCKIQQ